MIKLFETVLGMSLTASYVIAVVLVLRVILRKLPKQYIYPLWAVVLFRLLSPVSFNNVASLLPNVGGVGLPSMVTERFTEAVPIVNTDAAAIPMGGGGMSLLPWLWLWLVGILLLVLYSAASVLLLRSKVAGAVCIGGKVCEAPKIEGPFVMGVVSPKIYLPPDLSPDERGYILLHEQIHMRHMDYIIKPIAFAALCIHWFNPLCWLAFALFSRDMEMFCDEGVIHELGEEIRPRYSDSLLSMATRRGFLGASPLAFGASGVPRRIKNVLSYQKPKLLWAVPAFFAVVLTAGGLATNPIGGSVQKAEAPWADSSISVKAASNDAVHYTEHRERGTPAVMPVLPADISSGDYTLTISHGGNGISETIYAGDKAMTGGISKHFEITEAQTYGYATPQTAWRVVVNP